MKPKGGGEPTGELADAIKRDFGSFDDFKKQFTERGRRRSSAPAGPGSSNDGGKLKIVQHRQRRDADDARREAAPHAATSGSTPTTSTTATCARSTSRPAREPRELGLRGRRTSSRRFGATAGRSHPSEPSTTGSKTASGAPTVMKPAVRAIRESGVSAWGPRCSAAAARHRLVRPSERRHRER